MIARATLALMLACPTAATVMASAGPAAADSDKVSSLLPAESAVRRDKAVGLPRRSRSNPTAGSTRSTRRDPVPPSASFDDGLAYDTPRDADGRPIRSDSYGAPPRAMQVGTASWYGGRQWQGHLTTSGAPYDENDLTAAHATLPLGSIVRVRLVDSERAVVVTITDRPGTRRRIIDLSRAAAAQLGILSRGIAEVSVEPL